MRVIIVHWVLAIILFYLINWIGSKSKDYGYLQLSVFAKSDEAPAFNFLLRAATPIAYIMLISATFYYFGFDDYVKNIWLIVVYYFLFRTLYNIVFARSQLINWPYQGILWMTSIPFSYFLYVNIIQTKARLLPDLATIANELWIIFGLFVYALFNRVKGSSPATRNRKEKYIKGKYQQYSHKYGEHIHDKLQNENLETLVYAIMIYENFNRPKIFRMAEHLVFPVFSKTLGIMQITTDKRINDKESVILAIDKLNSDYVIARKKIGETRMGNDCLIKRETIAIYNRDDRYVEEVMRINIMLEKNH